MVVLKELILTVSTLGGSGGLERTESTDYFLRFNLYICMLHGFREPTKPTAAKADSPQDPEEESPAGNPSADQRRGHQLS